MKKCTHIIITALAFVLFMLPIKEAKASHAAGAEIIYEWLGGNTYRFFFKFYRDCGPGSAAPPATVNLCIYNNCANNFTNKVMQRWIGTIPPGVPNGSLVTAGCSNFKTDCENPNSQLPGYEEWWYSTIHTLDTACNSWKFAAWINARNGSNNLTGVNGSNLYVETNFDNTVSNQNSSPYFSIKPIPYVCINQPYTYNNGAIDPNGDSLVSTVINPMVGGTCNGPTVNSGLNLNTTPPISFGTPLNPIQTNNQFSLNQQTGQMTFTATVLGPSTLTVLTREYRNGTLIGSIMRDIQVQVLECTTKPPNPVPDPVIKGGANSNGIYQACTDQKIEFCFDVEAGEKDAVLILKDNLSQVIPNATMTYTNQRSDTVTACFSWTPTSADVGLHTFIVNATDSTCKPPGILLNYGFDFSIYVWGDTKAVPDDSICPRESAFLGVTGGDDYIWTVKAGGDPNSLSNPTIQNPVATPTTTTTYIVQSRANDYCPNSKDSVTITVLDGPNIGGQNDTVICPNAPAQLDVKLKQEPGINYTISWTPATYLSNPQIANPLTSTPNDITYIVELGSTFNKCKAYDTIFVDVLDGFSIDNPDTAVCFGEIIDIRSKGDSRYIYEWSTDAPHNGSNISDKGILSPTITADPVGTYKYTLTARYTGCADSTATIKIETQPIPKVNINEDASICYGDTMKLNATIDPDPSVYSGYTYNWTPGASLDNDKVIDPIFSGTATTTLVFTASTDAGCKHDDTVTLTVFPADFLFVSDDTTICPGDSAIVHLTTNGVETFQWSPDFNISDTRSMNPVLWPVTNQQYMVYGIDTNDCADTAYVKIVVTPKAILDLPDTVTLYPGEGHRLDPKGNCLYYSWFPTLGLDDANATNPYARPQVNTRYIVKGRTAAGCIVTDSIDVIVVPGNYIEVPNAFSPGSYGDNKVLHILRRGDVELKRFSIYNRWGEKLFETKDINQGWDGIYNGEPQPMGVYIYSIEAISTDGRKINKQGNITLIR